MPSLASVLYALFPLFIPLCVFLPLGSLVFMLSLALCSALSFPISSLCVRFSRSDLWSLCPLWPLCSMLSFPFSSLCVCFSRSDLWSSCSLWPLCSVLSFPFSSLCVRLFCSVLLSSCSLWFLCSVLSFPFSSLCVSPAWISGLCALSCPVLCALFPFHPSFPFIPLCTPFSCSDLSSPCSHLIKAAALFILGRETL